jgi:hypothetical protein
VLNFGSLGVVGVVSWIDDGHPRVELSDYCIVPFLLVLDRREYGIYRSQ